MPQTSEISTLCFHTRDAVCVDDSSFTFEMPSGRLREIVKLVLLPKWREVVKARGILFYWMEKAQESSCAEGGEGRKRDRSEFEREFSEV